MAFDPAALKQLTGGPAGSGVTTPRRPDVGALFQLALLAAAEGNDQEAGDYLRKVVQVLKASVREG